MLWSELVHCLIGSQNRWVWMEGVWGNMYRGGKSNSHAIPPLWNTLNYPHALRACKVLLSLLITRQFYWLVALLAVWSPMMALKLEGPELVRCYCSDRRAALVPWTVDANAHWQLCPLLSQHYPTLLKEEKLNWPIGTLPFIDHTQMAFQFVLISDAHSGGEDLISVLKKREVISSHALGWMLLKLWW